ncbi:HD-GYP domain-containing protein [candidate division WOR-3 bacterium]|nr:HD-GYP domain-containing protein [candidate division WOR-3 bacterium]
MRISFSSETSSSEDLELIETFAEYAATTIKSANIYDNFQREVEEHKATEGKLRNMQKKLEIRVKGQTGKLSEINKKMKFEIDRYKQTEKELKDNFKKLKSVFEGVVNAMSMIVEARDPYTAGHQRRVSRLACAIAKEMGITEERAERIRIAGLLHDIGKITIPGEILIKPGVLNKSEFEIIKNHPQVGYDILKGIDFPWHISEIVLQHHERLDGSGYPVGLSNKDILLEAKILAVADVVEAVSSHRPYRPSRGINKALRIITENKNILYDTAVVDACLHLFYESRFKFE